MKTRRITAVATGLSLTISALVAGVSIASDELIIPTYTAAEVANSGTNTPVTDLATIEVVPAPPTPEMVVAALVEESKADAANLAALSTSLNGYANGRIPSEALTDISFKAGHMMRADAAVQLERLNEAFYATFGRNLDMTDSYRSYQAQASARARKGSIVARAGTSNHGLGLAADLGVWEYSSAEYQWLAANAPAFGWINPDWARQGGSKPEPWHWEFVGVPV